uniref:Uncharacterized protein n=1 Tax=Anguilla anguilla TaxID=7936 RepID=A0A0E9TKJ4_ANGAN
MLASIPVVLRFF